MKSSQNCGMSYLEVMSRHDDAEEKGPRQGSGWIWVGDVMAMILTDCTETVERTDSLLSSVRLEILYL